MEVWKMIPSYEGQYEASNKGKIRSVDRVIILKDRLGKERPSLYKGRILKQHEKQGCRSNIKPTYTLALSKKGKAITYSVHRLIARTFLGELKDLEVNHKDGNRLNNNLDNLEIITKLENIGHAFETGLIKTRKRVAKLNECGETLETFVSEAEACRQIGVSQGRIGKSVRENYKCQGYKWKYI